MVALVLAFLIRTFEAEAFVIPTGSMAPTLMGRHKDVTCPKCGYSYRVGASEERDELGRDKGREVISGTCPMCRFTMDLRPVPAKGRSYPSYSGDRIVATKLDYQFCEPQRWDIAVFHFPLEARTDYIKRITGLPNESLRIQYGNVWTQGEGKFTIQRKLPEKILATMQPVFDNDYMPELIKNGLPPRWAPWEPAAGAGNWQVSDDNKTFRTDGTAKQAVWLGYQHLVPTYKDWAANPLARPVLLKPQLITDFAAYNTAAVWMAGKPGGPEPPRPPDMLVDGLGFAPGIVGLDREGQVVEDVDPGKLGLNWVGDLVVEFEFEAESPDGEILVDLVKGGNLFGCRLDLANGTATLTTPGAVRPARYRFDRNTRIGKAPRAIRQR